MQTEHRISINAGPEVIFRIYADVRHWHTWDPDTKHAVIDGPFRVGTRGKLTPAKGRAVPMLLTQVEPGRRFTVESKIPFFRMLFEHELTPKQGATEVVHRVTFSGLLSALIGKPLLRQVNAGLPVTLARLRSLAESQVVA